MQLAVCIAGCRWLRKRATLAPPGQFQANGPCRKGNQCDAEGTAPPYHPPCNRLRSPEIVGAGVGSDHVALAVDSAMCRLCCIDLANCYQHQTCKAFELAALWQSSCEGLKSGTGSLVHHSNTAARGNLWPFQLNHCTLQERISPTSNSFPQACSTSFCRILPQGPIDTIWVMC